MALDLVTIFASAAVGEIGKRLVATVTEPGREYLLQLMGGGESAAAQAAEHNASDFLFHLAIRIGRLEDAARHNARITERLAAAQADPDVVIVARQALVAAARSGDRFRRETLADIIAKRISAASDDAEALAANAAVDAVPRLTNADLEFLAVISAVAAVRPLPRQFISELSANANSTAPLDPATWLRDTLALLRDGLAAFESGGQGMARAIAASAMVRLWGLSYPLTEALGHHTTFPVPGSDVPRFNWLPFVFGEPVGKRLQRAWINGLQECILLPAGLLLGATTIELKTGAPVIVAPDIGDGGLRIAMRESTAWAGGQINRRFVDDLEHGLASRQSMARIARGETR